MFKEMQKALEKEKELKVKIELVDNGHQTPKDKCDEELEKYKKENGKYPEWNRQKIMKNGE